MEDIYESSFFRGEFNFSWDACYEVIRRKDSVILLV